MHSTRVCEVGISWCSTASHLAHVVLPPLPSCHRHVRGQGGGEVPRWISKVNGLFGIIFRNFPLFFILAGVLSCGTAPCFILSFTFPSIVSLPLTSACLWSIGLHVMTDATARSYVGSCELQVGAGGWVNRQRCLGGVAVIFSGGLIQWWKFGLSSPGTGIYPPLRGPESFWSNVHLGFAFSFGYVYLYVFGVIVICSVFLWSLSSRLDRSSWCSSLKLQQLFIVSLVCHLLFCVF